MKVVCLSDTHGFNNKFIPKGDLIIHAGDFTSRGRLGEVIDFLDWYSKLDFKYKILIAGNHDFFLESANEEEIIQNMKAYKIIYLNDSGIEIEGIKIWGSPITPWFYDWAFNRHRGVDIQKHWNLIPENTDILITHGPPFEIQDKTNRGPNAGCLDLLNKVKEIKPKYHIFGHIHEAYGLKQIEETTFINASICNLNYEPINKPIVFEI